MIILLSGENTFERDRFLTETIASFDGTAERVDGSEVTANMLPDLLSGMTLFSEKRLIVIKGLSENTSVWAELDGFLPRISDDVTLVLVEVKPDKRTKTYKALQKVAKVQDFPAWGERDTATAEQWTAKEAERQGVAIEPADIRFLVQRVGLEPWRLYHALDKLAAVGKADRAAIEEYIDADPVENVFNLFEAALRGDGKKVSGMIATLQLDEDPYRLFGLLSGQAFQLFALAVADKPVPEVAKDIGAHPYALQKMSSFARSLGASNTKRILKAFAEADEAMKTSAAEPWLLIERALMKTVTINK